MKTYYIFIAALALSLTSCTSSKWASADSYSDDLYFNANDKPLTVSNEYIPVYENKDLKKDNRKEVNSMQSGYIKENPNYSMEQVTDDFSNIQTDYTQLLTNDSINDIDTVLYYNDETGYWVDGFEGSAMDLDYATRLIRFHGPFMGVPYWSPVYTDVLYSNSWDWNVYVDGNYVYAFPTYTNSFYWNSGFNTGFGYGGFGFGMGYSYWNPWYSPYMGYPGYGWGYPGYGWGYPGYGWGYPGYGCGYPGYGPGYPGHPINPGYPSDGNYYYGSRVTNPTSGRMNPLDENITNHRSATSTALKSTPSSRTTRTISADNNMVITKGTNSYTRVARSNQVKPESAKKAVSNTNNNRSSSNGSVNIRTTRKSYSSYSKSASTKRPTFNRSTTSRSSSNATNNNSSSSSRSRTIYSAPRRSSSTSSRSSKTSSSSSRSTYRSGSSKSSAYSPSKSTSRSSSKSSYTSTPSSSSRSSGSSYSSGSSSRSSGGSSRSSGGSSRSTRGSR